MEFIKQLPIKIIFNIQTLENISLNWKMANEESVQKLDVTFREKTSSLNSLYCSSNAAAVCWFILMILWIMSHEIGICFHHWILVQIKYIFSQPRYSYWARGSQNEGMSQMRTSVHKFGEHNWKKLHWRRMHKVHLHPYYNYRWRKSLKIANSPHKISIWMNALRTFWCTLRR